MEGPSAQDLSDKLEQVLQAQAGMQEQLRILGDRMSMMEDSRGASGTSVARALLGAAGGSAGAPQTRMGAVAQQPVAGESSGVAELMETLLSRDDSGLKGLRIGPYRHDAR